MIQHFWLNDIRKEAEEEEEEEDPDIAKIKRFKASSEAGFAGDHINEYFPPLIIISSNKNYK